MSWILHDLRFASRVLFRRPTQSLAIILSLGLCIGANTTVFTFVNAIFLHDLGVEDPESVVMIYARPDKTSDGSKPYWPVSYLNFLDFQEQNDVFSQLAAYQWVGVGIVGGEGAPEMTLAQFVTGNYFSTLGVEAAYGRTFLPEEENDVQGAHPLVVLNYDFWQRRFGGDTAILGQEILLNGHQATVVGVAPQDFRGLDHTNPSPLWVHISMFEQISPFVQFFRNRNISMFWPVGRLESGVSATEAEQAMTLIGRRLDEQYPDAFKERSPDLLPIRQAVINPSERGGYVRASVLVTGIALMILLIACANVTNLLLAQAAHRRKEIAIRLAIGIKRWRLIRQMLTESMLLAAAGALVGLLLAVWGSAFLWRFRPPMMSADNFDLGIDFTVLGFTALVMTVTGLLFGLVPALRSARPDLVSTLKNDEAPNALPRLLGLRNLLVVAQVALCLVALLSAGLFLKSLDAARQIEPGFRTEGLVFMTFDMIGQGFDEVQARGFYRRVVEEVGALPEVESVALAESPMLAPPIMQGEVHREEQDPSEQGVRAQINTVGEGYFETLGIALLKGRPFTNLDRADTVPAVVVNESLARQLWPGEEAIGRRLRTGSEEAVREVVGVVADAKYNTLFEAPQPYLYLPLEQFYASAMTLHAAVRGDESEALATVRRRVQALDESLPLMGVRTMSEHLRDARWNLRMGSLLLGILAVLALVIASLGIYSVMAYNVTQRTRDYGIRLAIGAQSSDVLRTVVRQGMVPVGLGLAVGFLVALPLGRLLDPVLYGVGASDPPTMFLTASILGIAGFLGCWVPALRAMKIDPVRALRYE